ncbi:hypothetical protein Drose_20845 [Dactylosporangium roseum]|uniref:Uncharacterized protein n=1 Tax=Dactylosporangium roseum TaxID=47989 RepID=A0ABY5YY39_9ACTN|nr:hypothetical protein [Dactylosporangium roseum]UWZ33735.1 hypothetical protein Drose_20845 [Dactylosporangium roseum]
MNPGGIAVDCGGRATNETAAIGALAVGTTLIIRAAGIDLSVGAVAVLV